MTAGPRAYDVGTEAGRYPAMGFHTRGEMGGIWSPPMKLVDGIWFGINDKWIGSAIERRRPRGRPPLSSSQRRIVFASSNA